VTRFHYGEYIDISGQRFGMLVVLKFSHFSEAPNVNGRKKGRRTHWLCQCDCGNEVTRRKDALNSGRALDTKYMSCGCMSKQINREHFLWKHQQGINPTKHGDEHWTRKEPERAKEIGIKNLGDLAKRRNIGLKN
jgi:hypothetical protein